MEDKDDATQTGIMSEEDAADKAEIFILRELALKLWIEETLCIEDLIAEADPSNSLHFHYLNDLLESGVVLCNLMLTLRAKSIPKVHQGKDEHGFGRGKNIAFFLQACEENGVASSSLFRTGDLFLTAAPPSNNSQNNKGSRVGAEVTGPGQYFRVIDCIEQLAKLADKEWGFYFKLKSIADLKKRNEAGEFKAGGPSASNAIYFNAAAHSRADAIVRKWGRAMALKNAASTENLVKAIVVKKREAISGSGPIKTSHGSASLRPAPPGPPSPTGAPGMSFSDKNVTASPPRKPKKPTHMRTRSINTTFSALPTDAKTIKAVVRFQALFRGWMARNNYKRRVRNIAYRENVAQEIYKTEKDFVDSLKCLFEVYLDPIQSKMEDNIWKGGPKKEDEVELKAFKGLYNDLRVILAYNSKLLSELDPIVHNWKPNSKIAGIFLKLSGFLKVYTQYVKGYEAARMEFTVAKRNNFTFKRFFMEVEDDNKEKLAGQDISAFLIRPVQRIPRYLLLLKDLTRHTETDHDDYNTLRQAWEAIEKVAVYIEEKAEEADNFHMVSSIQARFSNKAENLVSVGRKYVRQGELEMTTPKSKKKVDRLFILFSDALVEAKKNRTDSKMGSLLRKRSMTIGVASMSKDLVFKRLYNLKTLRAKDDDDRTSYGIILDNVELGETVLRLYAPNKLTKFEWLNDFNAIRAKIDQDRRQREVAIRASSSAAIQLKRAISQQFNPEEAMQEETSSAKEKKRISEKSTNLEKSQSCRNLLSVPEEPTEQAASAPTESALQQLNNAKKDRAKGTGGGTFMGRLQGKSRNSYDARASTLRSEKETAKEREREKRRSATEPKETKKDRRMSSLFAAGIKDEAS